jgi:hypothetical protein
MASPKSSFHLAQENAIDARNIQVFLESVDETKPVGKLVKRYAEQYYYDGWWSGFFTGVFVTTIGYAVYAQLRR